MENTEVAEPELISIFEWARRLEVSKDSAYMPAGLGRTPRCSRQAGHTGLTGRIRRAERDLPERSAS
jgi:hypothetical protein